MNVAGFVRGGVLLLALALAAGCGKEKEQPKGAAPQEKSAEAPAAPIAVTEKDKSDAKAEAARVIEQIKKGEFQAMYREASPLFRELGAEAQFVAMMDQTRKKTGAMKEYQQTALETGADKRQVVSYAVQYDNVKSNLKLSFYRSKQGKMELVGLNQKDDAPKGQKKDQAKK